MDRCVVLVDAGYLFGAAATLLTGSANRACLAVDYAALIEQIRERAEADTGRPLLRIYWFDGAPNRVPQPEHRRLRVMSRVTLRLGALTRVDGRAQQKGVDAAMHANLNDLSRNRACTDFVLITGDGDLLPGVMAAKDHGVAIHLWAVQAADGDYTQSEDLVAEADERSVLDRSWLTQAIRAVDPDPSEAQAAAVPAQPSTSTGELPTPKDLAGRMASPASQPVLRYSSDTGIDPDANLPRLSALTTPEQVWSDREADLEVAGEPREVGRVFATRWVTRLRQLDDHTEHLEQLRRAYPRIPSRLDGDLLRYAARFGLLDSCNSKIDEGHRVGLRGGFWEVIDDAE